MSISIAAIALAFALQAEAQTTVSAPAPVAEAATSPVPLTWDNLPESLKPLVDKLVSAKRPQAVLSVETAAVTDETFRTVDHGDRLSEQVVRPAAFATLVTPARNTRKYGPAGAVLWSAVSEDGEWWCWRNGDRYPNWITPSDIYCYRDADNDGQFDQAMKNGSPASSLGLSRFQFTELGREERLADAIIYELGGAADFMEKVVIRYDGPGSARVAPDGRLIDGAVIFQLLTGPGVVRSAPTGNLLVQPAQTQPSDGLNEVDSIIVRLNAEGRGRYEDTRGIVIEVDRVDLNGKAQVKLTSGLPLGRTLLIANPTRDEVLKMLSIMGLSAAGTAAAVPTP